MYFKGREDAQTWRDRLLGKRIVSSERMVVEHEGWRETESADWEPRVYYSAPVDEGSGRGFTYRAQPESALLRLPAEIRNHILELVLPPQEREEGERGETEPIEWMNTSAIIFCCKQLFTEGRTMALNLHTIDWKEFPKRTRFCAPDKAKSEYDWNT
jgi:hypothetical protein